MFCRHCGAAVHPQAQFCAQCGNRFVTAQAPGYGPPPMAGIPVYTPPKAGIPGLLIAGIIGGGLLIVLILVAIAVPTFLGAQDRARDRSAQADLRNAMTAAKTLAVTTEGRFTNAGGTTLGPADLRAAEPLLVFDATGRDGAVGVFIDQDPADFESAPDTRIWLWTQSESGTWFGIVGTRSGVISYCSFPSYTPAFQSACDGARWVP